MDKPLKFVLVTYAKYIRKSSILRGYVILKAWEGNIALYVHESMLRGGVQNILPAQKTTSSSMNCLLF